jgi:hypothetical protein
MEEDGLRKKGRCRDRGDTGIEARERNNRKEQEPDTDLPERRNLLIS